jgi:hypothetical protein
MPGTSTERQLLDDNVVLFGIIVNEEEHSSMGGFKKSRTIFVSEFYSMLGL